MKSRVGDLLVFSLAALAGALLFALAGERYIFPLSLALIFSSIVFSWGIIIHTKSARIHGFWLGTLLWEPVPGKWEQAQRASFFTIAVTITSGLLLGGLLLLMLLTA